MKNLPIIVDPETHTPLQRKVHEYASEDGSIVFQDTKDGIPCFVPSALAHVMEKERAGMINTIKTILRRSPWLYRFLIFLISPICFTGISPKEFMKRFKEGAVVVNIGSGVHRYHPEQVNIDIFPYADVDVVADATKMPFADASADGALCECLLEHVPEPQKVVDEILRILKPGGTAYILIPFVYPFHASPNDFQRWSIEGLRQLLRGGEIESIGTRAGPTSALTAQLVTWVAIALSFGSETIYNALSLLLLLVFFPLKFLDLIFGRYKTAIHGAADFYAIVRKR